MLRGNAITDLRRWGHVPASLPELSAERWLWKLSAGGKEGLMEGLRADPDLVSAPRPAGCHSDVLSAPGPLGVPQTRSALHLPEELRLHLLLQSSPFDTVPRGSFCLHPGNHLLGSREVPSPSPPKKLSVSEGAVAQLWHH